MKTTNFNHIAQLVDSCFQFGIRNVVLSPGSRNAPLIIAFDSHPEIKTWIIHDERSAAFFALGLAESSNQPVAICCTSGSAVLNYSPAVAEAYYRRIPILVLSADRPINMIDQGDGQTIRQSKVLQNFVKNSIDLPDFSIQNHEEISLSLVTDALVQLTQIPTAPVHLNIPLEEPLYGINENFEAKRIAVPIHNEKNLSENEKSYIEKIWSQSSKKLFLIGQQFSDLKLMNSIIPILNRSDVAVLVENTTNLVHFEKIVHCIDRTLAVIKEDEMESFAPDLLITSGGAIISKKIKNYFRRFKPKNHWRVGQFLFEENTFNALTKSFNVSLNNFFDFVGQLDYSSDSTFGNKWKQIDFLAQEAHHKFLVKTNWSDLKAFEIILDCIPDNSNLHMANSSVVRYCQLFNPQKKISYFSNRGVSGIDGSTSTALGISNISEKLNVIITGDISFMYDSNALWSSYLKSNFKIIVINNGGGGIFKILDGPSNCEQENYFVAPHSMNVSKIAAAFGCDYLSAESIDELEKSLNLFLLSDFMMPVILEVKTFREKNEEVLKHYFQYILNSSK